MVRGSSWEGRHGTDVSLCRRHYSRLLLGIYNVEIRQEFLGEHLDESDASAPDWRLSPALQCLALLVASLGPQSALRYEGA